MIKTIFLALVLSSFAGVSTHAKTWNSSACNISIVNESCDSVYFLKPSGVEKVNKFLKSKGKPKINGFFFEISDSNIVKVTSVKPDGVVNRFNMTYLDFITVLNDVGIGGEDIAKLMKEA